jgi:hypothetical protein
MRVRMGATSQTDGGPMSQLAGKRSSPPARANEVPTNRTLGRAGQVAIVGLLVVGGIVGLAGRTGIGFVWFMPYAGVGAILLIRRPQTSIGWILLALGWNYAIVTANVPGTIEQFADATFDVPVKLFAVIHNGSTGVLFYLYLLLVTVLPSGRLPTGRWGGLTRLALAIGLVSVAAGCVMPVINATVIGYPTGVPVPVHNPVALLPDLPIWRVITSETVGLPILVMVVPAAISLVVRTRRSRGIERQQLRWIASSIGFVVLAVAAGFAIGSLAPDSYNGPAGGLAWMPALVAFPTVPIAIGIAVLRYRLYEIDRIISRTLTYGLLTAVLVGVYAAGFVLLQAVLARFTSGGGTIAVAVSTLAAFALSQPLRRRLQAAMDRRFNRSRYDAERTVERFAAHLRDEFDVDRLGGELRTVVGRSLAPASVGVWLRPSVRTAGR